MCTHKKSRGKEENKLRRTLARIEELIAEYEVEKIVVGYPKHLNNSIGKSAIKATDFAHKLTTRTGVEVILWDERLTTVVAHQILDQAGMNYKKKSEFVDKIAATFILQGYLDHLSFKKNL